MSSGLLCDFGLATPALLCVWLSSSPLTPQTLVLSSSCRRKSQSPSTFSTEPRSNEQLVWLCLLQIPLLREKFGVLADDGPAHRLSVSWGTPLSLVTQLCGFTPLSPTFPLRNGTENEQKPKRAKPAQIQAHAQEPHSLMVQLISINVFSIAHPICLHCLLARQK